jgi:hypothetical protein
MSQKQNRPFDIILDKNWNNAAAAEIFRHSISAHSSNVAAFSPKSALADSTFADSSSQPELPSSQLTLTTNFSNDAVFFAGEKLSCSFTFVPYALVHKSHSQDA